MSKTKKLNFIKDAELRKHIKIAAFTQVIESLFKAENACAALDIEFDENFICELKIAYMHRYKDTLSLEDADYIESI
tara:strand:- start:435 stop:665 length:231 start_codon:yes stop_codon:yes gene_type:complete